MNKPLRSNAKPERNAELLRAVFAGDKTKDIAKRFGISEGRVRTLARVEEIRQSLADRELAHYLRQLANAPQRTRIWPDMLLKAAQVVDRANRFSTDLKSTLTKI